MRKIKKWRQITQKEYDMLKIMFDGGITLGKIQDVTGRAWETLSRVRDSENLKEYRRLTTERAAYYAKKAKAKKSGVVVKEVKGNGETKPGDLDSHIKAAVKREEQMLKLLADMNKNLYVIAEIVAKFNAEKKLKKSKFFRL